MTEVLRGVSRCLSSPRAMRNPAAPHGSAPSDRFVSGYSSPTEGDIGDSVVDQEALVDGHGDRAAGGVERRAVAEPPDRARRPLGAALAASAEQLSADDVA